MNDSNPLVGRLSIFKTEPGLYDYEMTCEGQDLLVGGGFNSIVAAIEAGADITGPVTALEVAYRGIVAGTYPLRRLAVDAEAIARHAVETYAAVMS
ncbi:hypothetical protein [Scleromatobacter humisilvae]|uniref:Uncharacterized protein n=1 Tax=Scleromatobacter humisilvae TaxID=2897159 RepID=A0A9X1YKF3_9BURK|nr:hypothetical protein [Scleromatobacter humisilvae]MCK9687342.1 hypothetical protein [Scleromatobacter humisilvae]